MVRHSIAALALLGAMHVPAHAFYVQATPPAGWSAGGGAGGSVTGTKTAINSMFSTGSVSTSASLNMGGRNVALPASLRFAPNASRVAATAIMLNPYLRGAATIAGWLGLAGLLYDPISGLWTAPSDDYPQSDGYQYQSARFGRHLHYSSICSTFLNFLKGNDPTSTNFQIDSCTATLATVSYTASNGTHQVRTEIIERRSASSCPAGWYVTPAGCVQTPPAKTVTQEEAVEEVIKHPMPAEVPKHIPVPLPVEQPNIHPVFIPTGDPVKNPNFNPSEAPSPSNPPQVQPGVEVKPAPAPGSPWQVETTPVNRPVEDPTASPGRDPVPLPSPGGSGTGTPPPENKPQETPGLCDLYPNIIACMDAGQADELPDLPTKEIDFNFQVEGGFSGQRTCPAPKEIGRVVLDYSGLCTALDIARNVLLAMAWISAALIVLRGRAD